MKIKRSRLCKNLAKIVYRGDHFTSFEDLRVPACLRASAPTFSTSWKRLQTGVRLQFEELSWTSVFTGWCRPSLPGPSSDSFGSLTLTSKHVLFIDMHPDIFLTLWWMGVMTRKFRTAFCDSTQNIVWQIGIHECSMVTVNNSRFVEQCRVDSDTEIYPEGATSHHSYFHFSFLSVCFLVFSSHM